MGAGTGVRHAEYNLEGETTTLFQIWIEPTRPGGSPSWGAKPFPKGDRSGQFVTLASGFEGDDGALPIRADARVLGATIHDRKSLVWGKSVSVRVVFGGRAIINKKHSLHRILNYIIR